MTTEPERTNESASPPVAKLRIGLINAAVWKRVVNENTFHSVTFERRYRDGEGNWKSTHSFDTDDLLVLAKLADQAHSEVLRLRADEAA